MEGEEKRQPLLIPAAYLTSSCILFQGSEVASSELPCPSSQFQHRADPYGQQSIGNTWPYTSKSIYIAATSSRPSKAAGPQWGNSPSLQTGKALTLPSLPYKPCRLLMPPRCLCFGQVGPCQQLGGGLPGAVSLGSWAGDPQTPAAEPSLPEPC